MRKKVIGLGFCLSVMSAATIAEAGSIPALPVIALPKAPAFVVPVRPVIPAPPAPNTLASFFAAARKH